MWTERAPELIICGMRAILDHKFAHSLVVSAVSDIIDLRFCCIDNGHAGQMAANDCVFKVKGMNYSSKRYSKQVFGRFLAA